MSTSADLDAIIAAADVAYERNPGKPVTPAQAARLRPLVFPSADGQAAA